MALLARRQGALSLLPSSSSNLGARINSGAVLIIDKMQCLSLAHQEAPACKVDCSELLLCVRVHFTLRVTQRLPTEQGFFHRRLRDVDILHLPMTLWET